MCNYCNTITELIGNTPMLRLHGLEKNINTDCSIIAKLEYFNPCGSVKDRIAKTIIDSAEKNGELKSDSIVIEPTSGNTGIALASICATKGYRCIIVMPEFMSIERVKMIKAYGANVILTPKNQGMHGANLKAHELLKPHKNAFMPSQFDNPLNPATHFNTTGPEIFRDLNGEIDYFIAGIGTGGSISGVGRFLKEKNSKIKIIGVQPKNSSILTGGVHNPHKIQGIGAGFIPGTLDTAIYDDIIDIEDSEAFEFTKSIAKSDGLFVGISSGAVLAATSKLCYRLTVKKIL